MIGFEQLLAIATRNRGGADSLEASLPRSLPPEQLATVAEDRFLSAMALCVFRAGFSWKVIEDKWPAFERAFSGFIPPAVAHFSDDKLEQLAADTTIVRHLGKIRAVRDNAVFICEVQRQQPQNGEHGFARYVADWPVDNIVGLWLELKRRGSRLGGNTGPMVLRTVGKDTFILSGDVQAALLRHKLVDSLSVNAKRDLLNVQAVFNRLQQESGRSLAEISRILAYTV